MVGYEFDRGQIIEKCLTRILRPTHRIRPAPQARGVVASVALAGQLLERWQVEQLDHPTLDLDESCGLET
jgi:hypothetical protein